MKAALIRAVGDAATEYLSYVQGVEPGVPGDIDSAVDTHGNRLRTPQESADLWSDFFEHALQRLNVGAPDGVPRGPVSSCCAWCSEEFGSLDSIRSETQGNYHVGCYDLMIKRHTKTCPHCSTQYEHGSDFCCTACALLSEAPEEG